MTALRFAILTTFFPPYSFGGDAVGVRGLAEALARRGHEVTVVHDINAYRSVATQLNPPSVPPLEGVRTIALESRLGMVSPLLTHQFGAPVVHAARLREILRPGAHDVIWFHNVSLLGGPRLLALGDGLKVYEAHEHWLVCPTRPHRNDQLELGIAVNPPAFKMSKRHEQPLRLMWPPTK